MGNRAQQKDIRKKSFRWLNMLAVLIVLFFCLRMGGQVKQYFALQSEVDYYHEQLALTEVEYSEQVQKQELLYNDAYLERMAREKLGMVKEGEEVVAIMKMDILDDEVMVNE